METIRLVLPASPRHAATARVVAASLAADAGFDVDAIDDLRLAVNEAVAVLTDPVDAPTGADSVLIEIEFQVTPGHIDVRLELSEDLGPIEFDELATTILSAVVDHHEVDGRTFRLTKVVAAPATDHVG